MPAREVARNRRARPDVRGPVDAFAPGIKVVCGPASHSPISRNTRLAMRDSGRRDTPPRADPGKDARGTLARVQRTKRHQLASQKISESARRARDGTEAARRSRQQIAIVIDVVCVGDSLEPRLALTNARDFLQRLLDFSALRPRAQIAPELPQRLRVGQRAMASRDLESQIRAERVEIVPGQRRVDLARELHRASHATSNAMPARRNSSRRKP